MPGKWWLDEWTWGRQRCHQGPLWSGWPVAVVCSSVASWGDGEAEGGANPQPQPFPSLAESSKAESLFLFLCPNSVSGSECDWKHNGAGRGNPTIARHGLKRGNI